MQLMGRGIYCPWCSLEDVVSFSCQQPWVSAGPWCHPSPVPGCASAEHRLGQWDSVTRAATLGAPATPIRKVWKLGIGVSKGAAFRRICVKGNPARGSLPAAHRRGLRDRQPGGEGEGTRLLPVTPGALGPLQGHPTPWQCHPTPWGQFHTRMAAP